MHKEKTAQNFNKNNFLEMCFEEIAYTGWDDFSLSDFIQTKELTVPHYLKEKQDLLELFEDIISKELHDASLDIFEGSETQRERLFELILERFDLMTPYKAGLHPIFYKAPKNPKFLLKTASPFRAMIINLMSLAKIPHTGFLAETKIFGVACIYLKTCHVWLNDDTPDNSKTMAELDKNLNFADQILNTLPI